MSGAWAQACDGKHVARDDDHAAWAVVSLGQAMVWQERREQIAGVEFAGAHIRAWRKSLPVQGQRADDFPVIYTGRLLWTALADVCRARQWARIDSDSGRATAAIHLRYAEAALRTWWKRQVRL